jgi:hypothetical protein
MITKWTHKRSNVVRGMKRETKTRSRPSHSLLKVLTEKERLLKDRYEQLREKKVPSSLSSSLPTIHQKKKQQGLSLQDSSKVRAEVVKQLLTVPVVCCVLLVKNYSSQNTEQ